MNLTQFLYNDIVIKDDDYYVLTFKDRNQSSIKFSMTGKQIKSFEFKSYTENGIVIYLEEGEIETHIKQQTKTLEAK